MSIIKHVTLQKIVAHDFRYDPRRSHTTRTSLDELSARRRDIYLYTTLTLATDTSMTTAGVEHTISAGERP